MIRTKKRKSARLETRLTPAIYELVRRAARLQGRSISDFVVSAAQRAAEETIGRHELLKFSQADQERFAAAIAKPAPLASAMKRAAKAHQRLIQRS